VIVIDDEVDDSDASSSSSVALYATTAAAVTAFVASAAVVPAIHDIGTLASQTPGKSRRLASKTVASSFSPTKLIIAPKSARKTPMHAETSTASTAALPCASTRLSRRRVVMEEDEEPEEKSLAPVSLPGHDDCDGVSVKIAMYSPAEVVTVTAAESAHEVEPKEWNEYENITDVEPVAFLGMDDDDDEGDVYRNASDVPPQVFVLQ
jgi:hypothetical protein